MKNNKGLQAIRIPRRMRIDDDKVYLKKVGNSIFIIPFHAPWQNLIDSLVFFTPDFMADREQPPQQLHVQQHGINPRYQQ
ncbi:MAG: AbrB/MazE/SpoVT family DNA-binding domain-containing protein [Bacteroidetes bacterium]|nr:AbrB/MazE/SpoVT family DNA-binding domain-containing protein [Bacteroidota bacterium]